MCRLCVMCAMLVTCSAESLTYTTEHTPENYVQGTVYIHPQTGAITYKPDVMDRVNGTAYGYFNNTLNETGWSVLEIQTTQGSMAINHQLMFAAGYLEGVLTAKQIWQNFINMRSDFVNDNGTVEKIKLFYAAQDKWTRSMIMNHPSEESAYWQHVSYIMQQFDGLCAGYRAAALPEWDRDEFVIQMLNGIGDYRDLRSALNPHSRPEFYRMTVEQIREYMQLNGHCSALVKVTPGFENMFISHNTWFSYGTMMRIFKHYHFNVKDPATAAKSLSFSSYAGYIESLDDYYQLSSGLVALETTNQIYNHELFNLVKPQSLFAWQRVRVANMMAHSGYEWYKTIRMYNSGTYNNQYMVVDLKKVTLNRELANGTLWVIEQIPGLVVGADQTTILRAGYWASYNVPFYPVIYNMSGYPDMVNFFGTVLSHELTSRAKIFRRDQGSVVDMKSMQAIMRYNDYKNDPYSENDPCSSICCRSDLKAHPVPYGCYDAKICDVAMALNLTTLTISGPTTGNGLPPFSWSPLFDTTSHIGFPPVYNFDWVLTRPRL